MGARVLTKHAPTWFHRSLQQTASHALSFSSSSSASSSASLVKSGTRGSKKQQLQSKAVTARPSASPVDPDDLLIKLLKRDLKSASKTMQRHHIDIDGIFAPFEFASEEGCCEAILRRRIGHEEITIRCVLQAEEPDEEEALLKDPDKEIEPIMVLNLIIRLTKVSETKCGSEKNFETGSSDNDEPYVELLGAFSEGSLQLLQVSYVSESKTGERFPYTGPPFEQLNTKVQKAFHDIVKARGLDLKLANSLMEHLSAKYQSEYLLWARKLQEFVKT